MLQIIPVLGDPWKAKTRDKVIPDVSLGTCAIYVGCCAFTRSSASDTVSQEAGPIFLCIL